MKNENKTKNQKQIIKTTTTKNSVYFEKKNGEENLENFIFKENFSVEIWIWTGKERVCSKKLSNEKLNKKKKKSIFKEFKTTTISTSTTISQKSTLIQLKTQTHVNIEK